MALQRAYLRATWLIPSTLACGLLWMLFVPVTTYSPRTLWDLVALACTLALNFGISQRLTRVLADCRGGKRGEALWVATVAALGSLLCFGIMGTVVIQAAVTREVRKYGITPRFFGIAKQDFAAKIEELAEGESDRSDGSV